MNTQLEQLYAELEAEGKPGALHDDGNSSGSEFGMCGSFADLSPGKEAVPQVIYLLFDFRT